MQSIYEQCEGTYHKNKNGHLIPDLSCSSVENNSIGIWGQRRKKYRKEYHRGLYDGLLLTGKLYQHLSLIDKQAQERYDVIVKQMKKAQAVTEQLMFWSSVFVTFMAKNSLDCCLNPIGAAR